MDRGIVTLTGKGLAQLRLVGCALIFRAGAPVHLTTAIIARSARIGTWVKGDGGTYIATGANLSDRATTSEGITVVTVSCTCPSLISDGASILLEMLMPLVVISSITKILCPPLYADLLERSVMCIGSGFRVVGVERLGLLRGSLITSYPIASISVQSIGSCLLLVCLRSSHVCHAVLTASRTSWSSRRL